MIMDMVKTLGGYALVGLSFTVFVVLNGGIVVGDKTAHQAVLHFPQLLYFCLFTTFFSSPFFIINIKAFLIFVFSHKKAVLALIILSTVIVHFNTLVHPYLLADNRHYTFYIWKRLYEKYDLFRYLVIPAYLYGAFSIYRSLHHRDLTFHINFLACLILCLVPQKLLEFRYYIVPYLLIRLNMCVRPWWQYYIEFALYFVINCVTLDLFVTREFYWKDSDDIQRFLW